ncbi:MADS-box transcription factor ANR1-like [Cajanus cajan]|nr:MADS-box transcription factor ANR1-like [Cajanus cajan]
MGEELSALDIDQLKHLEDQLETGLKNVRTRKDQMFIDEIKELQQKGSLVQQQKEELLKKIDLIHKENAELKKVVEARRAEEKESLNPSHAISNGYDKLYPNSLQQSQSQPQHRAPSDEAIILGYSLKLKI